MSKEAIQAHATALQVPFLTHFTRVKNLPEIMQYGIYPVSRVAEIGVAPEINDQLRLDGHRDGTSLSIAFPNDRMFYKYRKENPEIEWAVLTIQPAVLWTKNCAFCRHNAADARISCQPLAQLKSSEAFVGMYEEIEGLKARQEQKLKPFDPTDVQAEVLVFDVIEPGLIGAVAFESHATLANYQGILGDRQVFANDKNKGYFATRSYGR